MKRLLLSTAAVLAMACAAPARADAADQLRDFARLVQSGKASFTQTVTSADGARKKVSSGSFEFLRPNRFRFAYTKPFEQLIVADGQKVWIFDADLNQASSRKIGDALGATPAALLAGGALDQDFTIAAQPDHDGLAWAEARPKAAESTFKSMRVGFKGRELAAIEVVDNFGQRSLLQFGAFTGNHAPPAETFRFVPPKGADVIEQ